MAKHSRFSSIMQSLNEFCDLRIVAVGLGIVALTHCSSEVQANSSPLLGVYIQVDRVGRPGVKEIFENYATHETTNRNSPSSDATALSAAITNFMTASGSSGAVVSPTNGSASDATKLSAIFTPDELQANLNSSSATASYLSLELGNSSAFGGRSLADPAMEYDLSAIYGGSVNGTSLGLGVTPNACMVTDGLTYSTAGVPATTTTFPYLSTTPG